jgi:23S rRNA pseudouridine1911/1915/1917 synthase
VRRVKAHSRLEASQDDFSQFKIEYDNFRACCENHFVAIECHMAHIGWRHAQWHHNVRQWRRRRAIGGFPYDAPDEGQKQDNHDDTKCLDQAEKTWRRSLVYWLGVCAIARHMVPFPENLTALTDQTDRLDRFLAQRFPDVSRARFQRLIAEGHVKVEGTVIADSSFKLRAGMDVLVVVPPPIPAEPEAEAIDLDVVFEDSHLIVINKPAGLVVHPAAGHDSGTLVNALLAHCGTSLSGIGGVKRPGIVHRLDKDTSGLLVIAKNDAAHQSLSEQFQAHGRDGRLQRRYLAFVWGQLVRPAGTISTGLARSTANRQKMSVSASAIAKEAITHYIVKQRFGEVASLVECTLETGRTHQIRVHMTHIGHPLLGDTTYGGGFKSSLVKLSEGAKSAVNALKGQALHATLLGFEHPKSGRAMLFERELPQDLSQLHHELLLQFPQSGNKTRA